jgi:dUTP pyrophosphatase
MLMSDNLILKVKKVREYAILPTRTNDGDMYDLYSSVSVEIKKDKATIVPLGIAFDIPKGYRIKIFTRSSLPLKKSVIIANGTGIIDTGYKNEVGLILVSFNEESSIIEKGDKVAQFQLEKIVDFTLQEVQELDKTNDRGGGFGSTGEK